MELPEKFSKQHRRNSGLAWAGLANHNHSLFIKDRVDKSVITLPDSVKVVVQLLSSLRARLRTERTHSLHQAVSLLLGYSLELLLYISMEFEGTGH